MDDAPQALALGFPIVGIGASAGGLEAFEAFFHACPVDTDKAFVRNVPGAKKDETIARAIITMGLGLDMNVIAEGVETECQREFLQANGCNAYQGYLFSRPLPLPDLEVYLRRA